MEITARKDDFFKLLDTSTSEIVSAIKVTTPPNFPRGAKRAIRFLLEKEMARIGISMDIFFVAKG